jgi:hypothetical protein
MDSDFSHNLNIFTAALLIVVRRVFQLVVTPYKTMRKISLERDYVQLYVILFLIFVYFLFTGIEKIVAFLFSYSLTFLLFYYFGKVFNKQLSQSSLIFTLTYTFIPTLTWFVITYFFYLFLPPPRGMTLLGKGFSIFYIAFSVSLFLWKSILLYLALRFSLKRGFYPIVYSLILYCIFVYFFTIIMYKLGLSKVPFI